MKCMLKDLIGKVYTWHEEMGRSPKEKLQKGNKWKY